MATGEKIRSKTAFFVILGSLALVTLIFHKDIFGYSFDGSDTLSLIDTSRIHSLHDIFGNYTMAGTGFDVAVHYRPVSVLTYSLDYAVWGLNPFWYHLTDFLLHLVAVFLASYLAFTLTRSRLASFLTGLLFTVHPIVIESLAASSRRQTILPVIFVLAAFLLFIKYIDDIGQGRRYLVFSLISYLLALGSEEIAFVLPVMLVVYLAIFSAAKLSQRDILAILRLCAPYLVVTAVFLVWRTVILHGIGGYQEGHQEVNIPGNSIVAFPKISYMYFSDLLYPGDILGWLFRPLSLYSWQSLVYLFAGGTALFLLFYTWRLINGWDTRERKERNIIYSVFLASILLSSGLLFSYSPLADSFLGPPMKQGLRSLIPLLIIVCGLILIAVDQRRKLIDFYRHSVFGKLVLFAVIWMFVPLLVYLPTSTYAHRNAYFSLVPFSILVSVLLMEGQKAAKAAVASVSANSLARNAGRIAALLFVAALVISFPLSTYLINRAGEWKADSDVTQLLLARITENIDAVPKGSEVEFYDLPAGISYFEGQFAHAKEISYPQPYSIKSWMDLEKPDNQLTVTRGEWVGLRECPSDLNLRIEQIGETKYEAYIDYADGSCAAL